MTTRYVPIGAVLVIEHRRCLKCNTTYEVPAHRLAQLYCAPHDPNQHSIEPSENIVGSKRTVYHHNTTCERCANCYHANLDWEQVGQLKIIVPHLPADIAPYEDYAMACSVRDKLRNDAAEAFKAYEKSKKKFGDLSSAYNQAKHHAKSLARAKQPDTPAYQYSTKPTKMRDIFLAKKEPRVIIPATDDEI